MLDTRFAGVWNTGFCSLERCKSLLNIWAQKPKKRPSLPLQLWLSALAWLWQLWQLWQLHSPCLIPVPAYFSSSHWGIDMPCSKISKIHWIFIGYSLDIHWICRFCQKKTSTCWEPWRKKTETADVFFHVLLRWFGQPQPLCSSLFIFAVSVWVLSLPNFHEFPRSNSEAKAQSSGWKPTSGRYSAHVALQVEQCAAYPLVIFTKW